MTSKSPVYRNSPNMWDAFRSSFVFARSEQHRDGSSVSSSDEDYHSAISGEIIELEEISSTFTCEICIEPMQSYDMFRNNGKCIHPFCKICISKHFQAKVEFGSDASIPCPGLDCTETIDLMSFRYMIPQKVFDKLCDNLFNLAILNFDKCYCPNNKCSVLIVNECGALRENRASECPSCKDLFCFKCKVVWHSGYRCDESHHRRDLNDVLFGRLMETKKWTRCPACGHSVERISGCRVIKCRCNTSFCHKCGERGGHFHVCQVVDTPNATTRRAEPLCTTCGRWLVILVFFFAAWLLLRFFIKTVTEKL